MASLVPGTLIKLLQHMNTDIKISGEHRSSLLQVVSIVPTLAGGELFSNKGFYLKVSDSSHATYVSLPDVLNDLISSDKIQLGQYIHVDRLEASTPVPIIRGLRPIPGRHPCLGNPEDLVATKSLGFLNNEQSKNKIKLSFRRENIKSGKLDMVKENNSLTKSCSFNSREQKKEAFSMRTRSISSRAIPSSPNSCYSLPNLFEKFSNGIKQQQAKVRGLDKLPSVSRMGSLERRSNVSKTSTAAKDVLSSIGAGPKALRKSWDGRVTLKGSNSKTSSKEGKPKAKSVARTAAAAVPCRQLPKNEKLSLKEDKKIQNPTKKISAMSSVDDTDNLRKNRPSVLKKATEGTHSLNPGNLVKVSINSSRNWTDGSVSWASLPLPLEKIGKEVMKYRDAAQQAAINAIQDASAAENLVRCLSMYTELCSTASEANPHPTVEEFLNFYDTLTRANPIAAPSQDLPKPNNAASWVHAALSTNLSNFSLYTHKSTHAPLSLILEGPTIGKQQSQRMPSSSGPSYYWERGGGVEEQAELAIELKDEAGKWFLKFVERFLDADAANNGANGRVKVAGMMSQLKKVNCWLDGIENNLKEGRNEDVDRFDVTMETISRIRKKIYEHLLAHVETATVELGKG